MQEKQIMPKPKVLALVSFRIFPTLMGGQKGVALFYKYLSELLEVKLAASVDNEIPDGVQLVQVLQSNKKIYLNFSKINALIELIKDQDTDVIIAEHSYTGWLAWRLQKKTGRPFIIHSHNIESKRFRQMNKWWWKLYYRYEKWIHRKADHNFFISEDDRQYALREFELDKNKCSVVTYGIEKTGKVFDITRLKHKLGLDADESILLFNGTLDYAPNYDAVMHLIEKIDPLLSREISAYKIIITGNRAPNELLRKMSSSKNIRYAGYVEDVNEYYQCADLFLNPVVNDTGVKTKLIEAIANHCTSISTESGASGIARELCGNKLVTVKDHNWDAFVEKIIALHKKKKEETPAAFFEYYDWNHIAAKAAQNIEELVHE